MLGRGPRRYYMEIHPERLRGFREIATNPWLTGVCERVLGSDYQIIEVGFDVPLPGAFDQPWHRDFPTPRETTHEHRLTSLAFNMTTVDVTEYMGPFEIAPGTQWEPGGNFEHGMFPTRFRGAAVSGAGPAQAAEDGRRVGALRPHHPPRHSPPLMAGTPCTGDGRAVILRVIAKVGT
jgi:Phytanoyl-CoA dioxygenase (PhyH)